LSHPAFVCHAVPPDVRFFYYSPYFNKTANLTYGDIIVKYRPTCSFSLTRIKRTSFPTKMCMQYFHHNLVRPTRRSTLGDRACPVAAARA